MSAVSSCFPTTLLHALAQERHFLPHRLGQLREGRMPSIQQLQQIATAPAGPRRQLKRFQFLASVCSPQPLLTTQAFVQELWLAVDSSPGCASAPGGGAATAVAASHGCPSSVSRSAENDFPAVRPGYGGRPGERSSAGVLACSVSRWPRRSTTRSAVRPCSRSNQRACPLASIPTRTCVACLARSRSNVSASWRWRNGCSRNSPSHPSKNPPGASLQLVDLSAPVSQEEHLPEPLGSRTRIQCFWIDHIGNSCDNCVRRGNGQRALS